MIENMSSNTQVENAIHVAENYESVKYKSVDQIDNYKIVVFQEFKEDSNGNYKWIYDENDTTKYYCLSKNKNVLSRAKYDGVECGEFEQIKMDNKWCENYKNSTLAYEDDIEKLCEE